MPRTPPHAPPPDTDDDPERLRSRTDERRERARTERALIELAARLVELGDRALARLELPEDVLDAVQRARAIQSAPARQRALRLVRAAPRAGGAQRVEKLLRHAGRAAPSALDRELDGWCERLQRGGDAELGAFLELYPDADRRQLRQLSRNAARAAPEAQAASLSALKRALRRHLG